jgi:hypothetical protein
MQKSDFLKLMQQYVANIAISGSTLRNQGAAGIVQVSRKYLATLDMENLKKLDPLNYLQVMERWTDKLAQQFPDGAKNWGTARKAINVFMTQAFLNKYLSEEYGLQKFADVLEIPLDSQVAFGLRKLAERNKLPQWSGIRRLRPEISSRYQEFASQNAKERNIPKVCLDMIFWRADQ